MSFNKDAAIVAQNATAPAAALCAAIINANPEHHTTTESALALFDHVRKHIFLGSMALAMGVDDHDAAVAAVTDMLDATPAPRGGGGGRQRNDSAPRGGGNDDDPGAVVVNMGKHRGKTIAEIHAEAPDYLTWLVEKGNNKWLAGKVKAFLDQA